MAPAGCRSCTCALLRSKHTSALMTCCPACLHPSACLPPCLCCPCAGFGVPGGHPDPLLGEPPPAGPVPTPLLARSVGAGQAVCGQDTGRWVPPAGWLAGWWAVSAAGCSCLQRSEATAHMPPRKRTHLPACLPALQSCPMCAPRRRWSLCAAWGSRARCG